MIKYLEAVLISAALPCSFPRCTEGELALQKSRFSPFSFQVTLCSNTVQKYELALVVDVEGIGEEVLALLITARYHPHLLSLPQSPLSRR